MSEKSLTIDRNSSKKEINVSKYYKYIVKSFLTSLYVLFFGLLFFFLVIRMMPGNPYSLSEGNLIYDTEVTRLALDKNHLIQFFVFLKNTIMPVLYSARINSNLFRNVIRNSIFPITGVLCFNVSISILLFEGINTLFSYNSFGSLSFISLGRDIRMNYYPSSLFVLLIPSFLLFLIMSGLVLLGLGYYDYKLTMKDKEQSTQLPDPYRNGEKNNSPLINSMKNGGS